MSGHGLATRLYRGDAGLDIIGKRKVWFSVALAVLVLAALSFGLKGFTAGIDFTGGSKFKVPASVGSVSEFQKATEDAVKAVDPKGTVSAVQKVRSLTGGEGHYEIRTSKLKTADNTFKVKQALAEKFKIDPGKVSDSQVSGAWGDQVTKKALLGLAIFLVLVIGYLVIRFEWKMAIASVASLLLDLVLTATVYILVGFEVTPSTVVGFLTILGFALYDVVVVFDKVQENTHGILGKTRQTYAEAANLAVNQTLMRSINTGLVALLPVGGLLFIGAGLLGAGTLKDLGLVLFIGMGVAVYSSIFFATPVLVALKEMDPRFKAHKERVLAKRASVVKQRAEARAAAEKAGEEYSEDGDTPATVSMAGAYTAPRPGQRPEGRPGKQRKR
ncbi:protein translocase subunit SecF [Longispora albida]|uniref:protein translocase subunit SecF n=1 Tax=Longispora albida TaxID=203523 RepID=UPI00035CF104|nr:protein translocase subunit SecF [Longispora albida]